MLTIIIDIFIMVSILCAFFTAAYVCKKIMENLYFDILAYALIITFLLLELSFVFLKFVPDVIIYYKSLF